MLSLRLQRQIALPQNRLHARDQTSDQLLMELLHQRFQLVQKVRKNGAFAPISCFARTPLRMRTFANRNRKATNSICRMFDESDCQSKAIIAFEMRTKTEFASLL
jgi:hypothetical protein